MRDFKQKQKQKSAEKRQKSLSEKGFSERVKTAPCADFNCRSNKRFSLFSADV